MSTQKNEAVSKIKDCIQARQRLRTDALAEVTPGPLDIYPDAVKVAREQQATIIRAVIQEQNEMISLISTFYPDAA